MSACAIRMLFLDCRLCGVIYRVRKDQIRFESELDFVRPQENKD